MAYSHSERLSALDASFLELEAPNVHMHVGGAALYELGPLARADGSLDFERILAVAETAFAQRPRLRQKIVTVPFYRHPVWVDDDRFNLSYHLRHTALPFPGDERRLKRLFGRIMSQQLDRGKPLWEMWFVDGVGEDRFAVITKFHHCMVDGVSGIDLMSVLMRNEPDPTVHPARRWISRPSPSAVNLLADEVRRRAAVPFTLARAARRALRRPARFRESARRVTDGMVSSLRTGLRPASSTPLNDEIGPHRRIDWTRFDLEAAKEVRSRLGGTVNDVVLAVATATLRRLFEARGLRPADLDVRAAVPVSLRRDGDKQAGNRVSSLQVPLPLEQTDPRRRLASVTATTSALKREGQAVGVEALEELADAISPRLFVQAERLATRLRATNLIITNVPGAQKPSYLLGSRMLAVYPAAPLLRNQALSIALTSYDGGLFWCFNTDWEAVPDLHELVEWVDTEFELLRKAAIEGPD